MKPTTKANLVLLCITISWGLTFPVIHAAVEHITPHLFVTLRFTLAALCLLPLLWHHRHEHRRHIIVAGLVLGVLNCGIYLPQTIGLETISASRSAFITGFSVVIVPFLLPFFRLGKPSWLDISCALLSLCGLFILTGASFSHFGRGDFFTLLCAVSYAAAVAYLQYITPKIRSYALLTFYQIAFTIPLPLILSLHQPLAPALHVVPLFALLFCSLIATVAAFYFQSRYQQHTSAQKAALIYALEPMFAAFFGYLLNGEIFTTTTLVGGSIMLVSLMLPSVLALLKGRLATA